MQNEFKFNPDGVYVFCLDIDIPENTQLHITNNNENLTINDIEYISFPFAIEEIKESAKSTEIEFQLKISNVDNIIGRYVADYDNYIKEHGFYPIKVRLFIYNTLGAIVSEHTTTLIKPIVTDSEVTFTLGAITTLYQNYQHKISKLCRWKFKSIQCGYSGNQSYCEKTLRNCIMLENSHRFGGFI